MSVNTAHSTALEGRCSLLIAVGALVSCILALGLTATVSTLLIASQTQGMAAAVNQSGTLRMQSYRIGMALAAGRASQDADGPAPDLLADELERRLSNPKLTEVIPGTASDPIRLAYERVQRRWVQELAPAVERLAATEYMDRVDGFVGDIHELVQLIEARAERYIQRLLMVQLITLSLTVMAAVLALWLLKRRLVKPLRTLLHLAEQARFGDLSTRTPFVGTDELGRLGTAMNQMSDSLAELYTQLEQRVAIKTRDLERSNRSLRLLYQSAQSLDGENLCEEKLLSVLADLRSELDLRLVRLCLRDDLEGGAGGARSARPDTCPDRVELLLGVDPEVAALVPSVSSEGRSAGAGQASDPPPAMPFVIADPQTRYGILWVVPIGQDLAAWQLPVLESWAKQMATALNLRDRLLEGRRLAVHEERSILARELHDSLAQSLSYLKIQAVRLERILANGREQVEPVPGSDSPHTAPELVVADLRAGINSAYRQLRELLSSFRLTAGDHGLRAALQASVEEFQVRSGLEVEFENALPQGLLTPNQEVHVLQIVREALVNVRRHAKASMASIKLYESQGEISVEIADDGIGVGEVEEPWSHHGMSIMRERARSLGCELEVDTDAAGGTRVGFHFVARAKGFDPERRGGTDEMPGRPGSLVPDNHA